MFCIAIEGGGGACLARNTRLNRYSQGLAALGTGEYTCTCTCRQYTSHMQSGLRLEHSRGLCAKMSEQFFTQP